MLVSGPEGAPLPSDSPETPLRLRAARLDDVPGLHGLIEAFARRNYLLARSRSELYELIRDYLVLSDAAHALLGCAALHVVNGRLAELKSLAVAEIAQGRGLGRMLVEGCLTAARELGLDTVFCLTYQVDFFSRCGFSVVDRARLPEKVWGECVRCNKFLDCDEVAMWRHLPQDDHQHS